MQPWLRRSLFVAALVGALALLLLGAQAFAPLLAAPSDMKPDRPWPLPDYNYESWYAVPVQEGRIKPLQSSAIETVRQITGRSRFEGHDSVAVLLAWMLGDGSVWEDRPFILCDHPALRRAIEPGLPAGGRHVSPAQLRRSPGFDSILAHVSAQRKELRDRAHLDLSAEQLQAEQVGRRLVLFDALCGKTITRLHRNVLVADAFIDVHAVAEIEDLRPEQVVARLAQKPPRAGDPLHLVRLLPEAPWFSVMELRLLQNDGGDWQAHFARRLRPDLYGEALATAPPSQEAIGAILTSFDDLRSAYGSGDAGRFADASQRFWQRLGSEGNVDISTIALEVDFNRWQPFLWSWITMLAALVVLTSALVQPQAARCYRLGVSIYVLSLLLQTFGFALRLIISGRPPVSNMYESVIFAAYTAGILALILESICHGGIILVAGALVGTLGLILADQLPLALDPKISPVVPVLRTNYWLTVHVLTIVCSYAAGTLAWGLGNLTLARMALGRADERRMKALASHTYRALQVAVLLLAAGTFLGGWWAAESWGRFWGWDPKEVGALVALVCYVIPLHARYLGWLKDFGLAVAAVLCYASILLSWYVVNFLVATGLHSYGFGSGGGVWFLWAGVLNLEWVVIATLLYERRFRLPLAA